MPKSDPPLPPVFHRRDALAAGLGRHQIDNRVATARWQQLSRGAYCLASTWDDARPEERQILEVTAALEVVSYPAFASHASAAALLGLPVPSRGPAWITRLPPASTRYSDRLNVEVATIPERDRWTIQGLPATSLRRTVADCLRHLRPPDALAVLDAALRKQPGLREDVSAVLAACEDWPYAAAGRSVLPLGEGLRESALESWSFWYFHQFGIPMPEPQVDLFDEWGTFLGRGDAWWHQFGVVGEADGRSKYAVPPGGDPSAALYDEKRREDALRRAGAGVIRWGARDLADPRAWAVRVMRELTAYPRDFRGTAVPRRQI